MTETIDTYPIWLRLDGWHGNALAIGIHKNTWKVEP